MDINLYSRQPLGYQSSRHPFDLEALRRREQRNDRLLELQDFQDFLSDVANRCAFLSSSAPASDWERGRTDALRDLLCSILANSDKGHCWLADFAADRRRRIVESRTGAAASRKD